MGGRLWVTSKTQQLHIFQFLLDDLRALMYMLWLQAQSCLCATSNFHQVNIPTHSSLSSKYVFYLQNICAQTLQKLFRFLFLNWVNFWVKTVCSHFPPFSNLTAFAWHCRWRGMVTHLQIYTNVDSFQALYGMCRKWDTDIRVLARGLQGRTCTTMQLVVVVTPPFRNHQHWTLLEFMWMGSYVQFKYKKPCWVPHCMDGIKNQQPWQYCEVPHNSKASFWWQDQVGLGCFWHLWYVNVSISCVSKTLWSQQC